MARQHERKKKQKKTDFSPFRFISEEKQKCLNDVPASVDYVRPVHYIALSLI
jgi:hypothetical protein